MNKRILSELRARYPLLFSLPVLLCLQSGLINCLTENLNLSLFLTVAALVCWLLYRAKLSEFVALTLLACVSLLPLLIQRLESWNLEKGSYLVRVSTEPRLYQAGAIDFGLELHEFQGDPLKSSILGKFSRPKLKCKAVYLPWRNIVGIKRGEFFVAFLSPRRLRLKTSSWDRSLFRQGYVGSCRVEYVSRLSEQPRLNPWAIISNVRSKILLKVQQVLGNGEAAGLFLSMSIGANDVLTRRTEEAFKRTGLAHLLVVSGFQVTLIYFSANFIFRKLLTPLLLRRPRPGLNQLATTLALLVTFFFVLLVGFDGPSLRALIAVVVYALARNLERGQGILNALLISILVIALISPGAILDPSLQLTYAAILGIALGLSSPFPNRIFRFLMVNLWAGALTGAVVAFWFKSFSLIGFILNPLLAPVLSAISCQIGFFIILLLTINVELGKTPLVIISWVQQNFKESIVLLSQSRFAAFDVAGLGQSLVLLVVSLCVFLALKKRLSLIAQCVGVNPAKIFK